MVAARAIGSLLLFAMVLTKYLRQNSRKNLRTPRKYPLPGLGDLLSEQEQLMNAINAVPAFFRSDDGRQWFKAIFFTLLLIGLFLLANKVYSSDGQEFADSATKFSGWITGNGGKVAALLGLFIGLIVVGISKNWTWLLPALVISLGVGVFVGIINASFTALI